ncbi:MAG TPA: phosphopantetheine-binding protein [Gemmatimonadales bacterium]|nr:phosphopantetheine-binding protein [Gemmatimonadales bacterium]
MADLRPIVERLRALFADELNIVVPADDTDLQRTGLLDSLVLVEVLVHVEQLFGVTFDLEELEIETFRSVRSIAELIAMRRDAIGEGLPSPP